MQHLTFGGIDSETGCAVPNVALKML